MGPTAAPGTRQAQAPDPPVCQGALRPLQCPGRAHQTDWVTANLQAALHIPGQWACGPSCTALGATRAGEGKWVWTEHLLGARRLLSEWEQSLLLPGKPGESHPFNRRGN